MPEITPEILHKLCRDETIFMTQHMALRCRERKIRYADIKHAILTGEIIENYPDDYPQPSCLILGTTESGAPLHVVAGASEEALWLITAYYPDPGAWEADMKTRKEKQK